MKRFLVFAIVVLALVGSVVACSPPPEPQAIQSSVEVQVPSALADFVTLLLITALTAGFTFVFEKTGLDLSGYTVPLSMTVSAFIVGLAQGYIDLVPAQYDYWIQLALDALVYIVGGLGLLRLYAGKTAASRGLLAE